MCSTAIASAQQSNSTNQHSFVFKYIFINIGDPDSCLFAAKYSYLSNSCMQKQEFHFFCNFFDMLPEAFSPLVKQRQKSISAFHQRWKFFWDLSISNKDFRMFRSKISHFVFIADVGLARQKQLLCCYYKVKFDTFSCKRYPNMNFHKGLTLPHLQKVSKLSFVWGRIDC